MRFTLSGIEYETSEMEAFPLKDEEHTTIFMDRFCQVFVVTQRERRADVHQASTPEILELAEKHQLEPLSRAIRCPEPFN